MSNGHAIQQPEAGESEGSGALDPTGPLEFVRERPWVAVVGAAFAGYVLARFVRRMR